MISFLAAWAEDLCHFFYFPFHFCILSCTFSAWIILIFLFLFFFSTKFISSIGCSSEHSFCFLNCQVWDVIFWYGFVKRKLYFGSKGQLWKWYFKIEDDTFDWIWLRKTWSFWYNFLFYVAFDVLHCQWLDSLQNWVHLAKDVTCLDNKRWSHLSSLFVQKMVDNKRYFLFVFKWHLFLLNPSRYVTFQTLILPEPPSFWP